MTAVTVVFTRSGVSLFDGEHTKIADGCSSETLNLNIQTVLQTVGNWSRYMMQSSASQPQRNFITVYTG